jgi:crotonobetainyl-CoA:carnitine CoA-transferase CaiB-like acyl-CoA transferase
MDEEGLATPAVKQRDWDSYNHNLLSQEEVDQISRPIAAFLMTKTMTELYDAALARGLMLAPANTAREILASKQYASRNLFVEMEDPTLGMVPLVRSFVASDAVPGVRGAAP